MTKLDHVAMIVTNLERSIEFFKELTNCGTPTIAVIEKQDRKFRSAMLPLEVGYLQLIEPNIGPYVADFEKNGEGSILEVGLEVKDIEEFLTGIQAKGISPVDIAGQPISGKYILSSFGNKYFFLPKDKTGGTRIEIIERVTKS